MSDETTNSNQTAAPVVQGVVSDTVKLGWKVHTPNLLAEILNNEGTGMLVRPLQMFGRLLAMVAERASELNDPEMNKLMCRLTLYSVADPTSPDYNAETLDKVMSR